MMYPASFIFDEPSTAYIFLIVINLFVGITYIITSFLFEIFQFSDKVSVEDNWEIHADKIHYLQSNIDVPRLSGELRFVSRHIWYHGLSAE